MQVFSLLNQVGMSRFLSKHVARTRKALSLVLASEVSTQQPSGEERVALERALALLTPEEQQLLLAAEIPGWPDREPQSFDSCNIPFRSLLTIAPPRPDDWGVNFAADNDGKEDPVSLDGIDDTSVTLAAVVAAIVPGGKLDVAASSSAANNDPPSIAAQIPLVGGPPLSPRPMVLPETRLLWKATAHELIRSRLTDTRRHNDILKAMGSSATASSAATSADILAASDAASAIDLCSDVDEVDELDFAEQAVSVRKVFASSLKGEAVILTDKPMIKKRRAPMLSADHTRGIPLSVSSSSSMIAAELPASTALGVPVANNGQHEIMAQDPKDQMLDSKEGRVSKSCVCASPPAQLELIHRSSTVVVFPLSRMESRSSLLRDLSPSVIVMFDPDPAFTREVEVCLLYHNMCNYNASYRKLLLHAGI